jgi:uncharacterized protein
VIPRTPSPRRVVTIETPLAQCLMAARNCSAVTDTGDLPAAADFPALRRSLHQYDGPLGPTPRIESFFIPGPAGRIECLLKHPAGPPAGGAPPAAAPGDAAPGAYAGPVAAAVVCHPHPLFGGTMHNKVVHAAAEAMVGCGLPVLRFNFRGVGGSSGTHDAGRGEQDDLTTVIDHLAGRFPGIPLLVAGYSFGACVALAVGCRDPRAAGLIGIGPPLTLFDFSFLAACRKPLTLIQGDRDQFGPPELLLRLGAALPGGARVSVIRGAPHGFDGHLQQLAARVVEAIPEEFQARP